MICGHRSDVFAWLREFLSFLAMIDDLGVQTGRDGRVARHRVGDVRPRAHRHAELEVNLVVRGTASYLLGDRRYALTPGTLTWLFPGQDHVLVDESSGHELWWAVFRPALVDEALAFAAQRLEIARGQGVLQDEEALFAEPARVLGCDVQS